MQSACCGARDPALLGCLLGCLHAVTARCAPTTCPQAFADILVAKGYTRLVMQIGRCAWWQPGVCIASAHCCQLEGHLARGHKTCSTKLPQFGCGTCWSGGPGDHTPQERHHPFHAAPPHRRADYRPRRLLPPNRRTGRLHNGLAVEYFEFAPSLAEHLRGAALVVSHAGACCGCARLVCGQAGGCWGACCCRLGWLASHTRITVDRSVQQMDQILIKLH